MALDDRVQQAAIVGQQRQVRLARPHPLGQPDVAGEVGRERHGPARPVRLGRGERVERVGPPHPAAGEEARHPVELRRAMP